MTTQTKPVKMCGMTCWSFLSSTPSPSFAHLPITTVPSPICVTERRPWPSSRCSGRLPSQDFVMPFATRSTFGEADEAIALLQLVFLLTHPFFCQTWVVFSTYDWCVFKHFCNLGGIFWETKNCLNKKFQYILLLPKSDRPAFPFPCLLRALGVDVLGSKPRSMR